MSICFLRFKLDNWYVYSIDCTIYWIHISLESGYCELLSIHSLGRGNLQGRARRLFLFSNLGSRTTIKQYGLVRNRHLLGHDDNNFLHWKNNKSGIILIICMFTFYFRITVSEAPCHIINQWCPSLEKVFFYFCSFWRHRDQASISKDIKMYEN